VPGLPVDRHVLRVSNRIGIARSDDPVIVEQQLNAAVLPAEWTQASDTLILHGRRICKPRPLCDRCIVRTDCNFYEATQRASARRPPKPRGTDRRASKPQGTRRGGSAPLPSRSESGSSVEVRRPPKPRDARRGGTAPRQNRSESGSLPEVRRAPKARGTGRGGGAPRQPKK
jgi:adenine-specific DNA glycosylase